MLTCSWFWPTILEWNFQFWFTVRSSIRQRNAYGMECLSSYEVKLYKYVSVSPLHWFLISLRKLSMPDSIFKMKTPSYSTLSEFPGQNTDTPTHKVAKFWIFWNTQGGLFRKSTSCIHTIWQISAYYFLTYQDSRTVWPKSFEKIPNRFFIHSLQMALCSYLSISYLDKIWREVKFEYSLT